MGGQEGSGCQEFGIESEDVDSIIGPDYHQQLLEDIELLDGASDEFDMELVSQGKAFACFLRFRPYEFRCGDIPDAFSSDDDVTASEKDDDRYCRSV